MNLEDVIDPEYGLQQDEWSLTRPKFGKEEQLEVIGWSGRCNGGKGDKYYILKCSKCSQDNELFGEGYFKARKDNIISGKISCGCGRLRWWSIEQYAVLCKRKAKELGYTFLGFAEEWQGNGTKIKMLCAKHGEWGTGNITNLINSCQGCPMCRIDSSVEASTKPNDVMIDSFLKTGAFHPDTKFWRSERKTKYGVKRYWFVSCPECGETGESLSGNLQRGKRPCACSTHRQQEAYVNLVVDDHDVVVAIKFGIANNSRQRIKQQNSRSVYSLKLHSVYTFPSVEQCKKAERECKQEIECGMILKRDMPDGYTETTWLYNLEKIEEIYKRNGGIQVSQD